MMMYRRCGVEVNRISIFDSDTKVGQYEAFKSVGEVAEYFVNSQNSRAFSSKKGQNKSHVRV